MEVDILAGAGPIFSADMEVDMDIHNDMNYGYVKMKKLQDEEWFINDPMYGNKKDKKNYS